MALARLRRSPSGAFADLFPDTVFARVSISAPFVTPSNFGTFVPFDFADKLQGGMTLVAGGVVVPNDGFYQALAFFKWATPAVEFVLAGVFDSAVLIAGNDFTTATPALPVNIASQCSPPGPAFFMPAGGAVTGLVTYGNGGLGMPPGSLIDARLAVQQISGP